MTVSVVAAGLIAVVRILLLVTSFLFLTQKCQSLTEAPGYGINVELTSANACHFFLV